MVKSCGVGGAVWYVVESEICEDLLLCNNLWQNHQGQGSQVCGHVVSYWRNYGSTHWVLHHQWSGDYFATKIILKILKDRLNKTQMKHVS